MIQQLMKKEKKKRLEHTIFWALKVYQEFSDFVINELDFKSFFHQLGSIFFAATHFLAIGL